MSHTELKTINMLGQAAADGMWTTRSMVQTQVLKQKTSDSKYTKQAQACEQAWARHLTRHWQA